MDHNDTLDLSAEELETDSLEPDSVPCGCGASGGSSASWKCA